VLHAVEGQGESATSLLFLAILPFWTNYLIRTYAWIVLLNPVGVINNVLIYLGLISQPLSLLYNEFAVILGLVYNYTPFVILAIYSLQRLIRLSPRPRAI
jgi:spermidine/putrescine transport system permease protein